MSIFNQSNVYMQYGGENEYFMVGDRKKQSG